MNRAFSCRKAQQGAGWASAQTSGGPACQTALMVSQENSPGTISDDAPDDDKE